MTPRLIAGAALAALLLGAAPPQKPLRSGPPVGSLNNRDGFFPQWLTGPVAGKRVCPV